MSNTCSRPTALAERLDAIASERAALLAEATNSFAHVDLMQVLAADERCLRAAPTAVHPILNRLVAEATPAELGGSSMIDVLMRRLLIGKGEAGRRIRDAAVLGPRRSMTGEPLEPLWAATAEGQAAGEIGPEQLAIIRWFVKKVPSWVDSATQEAAEHSLAAIARVHQPAEVQASADLLLQCIHPDGDFSDKERKATRWITIGPQDANGMSKISGRIDPELRAMIEAVLAVWARYGTCNPDHPTPEKAAPTPDLPTLDDVLADFAAAHANTYPEAGREAEPEVEVEPEPEVAVEPEPEVAVEPEPESEGEPEDRLAQALATPIEPGPTATAQELADHDASIADASPYRDTRTQGQRNHDALAEVFRTILSSHTLPTTRGAPTTVVMSFTAQQLMDGAGHVITATGTWLPFGDAIRMAKNSYPYLAVFDDHASRPLYLGRGKRIATHDQYLVLFARDRGCARPGCPIAAAHCEIHHHPDWANGGQTDVDKLSLHCTCDHRLLSLGYTARTRPDGRIEWVPPEHLDFGQPRVNQYFFPANLLREAEKKRAQQNSTRDKPPDVADTG